MTTFNVDGHEYTYEVHKTQGNTDHIHVMDFNGDDVGAAFVDHNTECAYGVSADGDEFDLNFWEVHEDLTKAAEGVVINVHY